MNAVLPEVVAPVLTNVLRNVFRFCIFGVVVVIVVVVVVVVIVVVVVVVVVAVVVVVVVFEFSCFEKNLFSAWSDRLSKFFIQKPIRRIPLRQLLNPFHSYPMVSHLSLTTVPMPTSAPTRSCLLMNSSPAGLEYSQPMDLARS